MFEPCKVSWCPFVELSYDWLILAHGIVQSLLQARMPLFVAQAMWFGMSNVCSAREWMEHGIEDHEV